MRQIRGNILAVDRTTRIVSMSFIHPRDGLEHSISGLVPSECRITVAGSAGTLTDLEVGQSASAQGLVHPDGRIEAQAIAVDAPAPAGG